jgi:hypothetical protein
MAVVINLTFAFKLLHLSLGLYYAYLDINAYCCSVSMKNNIKHIRDQLSYGK